MATDWLSDDDAEEILDAARRGTGSEPVTSYLAELRDDLTVGPAPQVAERQLAAMWAAGSEERTITARHRPVRAGVVRSALPWAACVAAFSLTGGLATAGALPAPVQRAVAGLAGHVGLELPGSDDERGGPGEGGPDDSSEPGQGRSGGAGGSPGSPGSPGSQPAANPGASEAAPGQAPDEEGPGHSEAAPGHQDPAEGPGASGAAPGHVADPGPGDPPAAGPPPEGSTPEPGGSPGGQPGEVPGQGGEAPGHDPAGPGGSEDAPGQDPDGPGASEDAPSPGGSGGSGDAPGQDPDGPGASEDAPGQGGSQGGGHGGGGQ